RKQRQCSDEGTCGARALYRELTETDAPGFVQCGTMNKIIFLAIPLILIAIGPASRGSDASPTTQGASDGAFRADREVIFRVENLGCPLVSGVGCGHLLAPLLARTDAVPGVERSATNWTGTLLRISTRSADQRQRLANDLKELLDADQLAATQL